MGMPPPPGFFDDDDEEEERKKAEEDEEQEQFLRVQLGLREQQHRSEQRPEILLASSILTLANPGKLGQLVESVGIAWEVLLAELDRDPAFLFRIDWRAFEQVVAAAYHSQGWTVTLTPRSGDNGVDVIAERSDIGSICVFDQVKHYAPSHVITRDQVDAMLGLIHRRPNVSKGVITTTSRFAPGVLKDQSIAQYMPNRLELRDGDQVAALLKNLRRR